MCEESFSNAGGIRRHAIEFQNVLRAARKTGARRRFLAEAEGALALS
jgi:hypothetical protein